MSPPQADTRVYDEAYFSYVEDVNPRIIPPWRDSSGIRLRRTGWKLIKGHLIHHLFFLNRIPDLLLI